MTGTDIGREDEALEACKGVVLGIYRAERLYFEVLEYAEDCPSELAGRGAFMSFDKKVKGSEGAQTHQQQDRVDIYP